ncbi:MAG: DegV family protein [Lachnospiraceae bacterium]|nr:DegV family protein [Lachnospiraceae bacterium]
MDNYKITCCSTVDMSREWMEINQIPFAMFHYQLNGKEYLDDLYSSISPDQFYKLIIDGSQPVTSQVNTEEYKALFEPLLEQGMNVLHLTLSSGISGTINSANIAKMQLEEEYPERKIIVVDSLSASCGYGMLVLQALDNQKQGMRLLENAAWLEKNKLRMQHWFFSTDLTSYIRGGRISKTAGFVGQVLDICPLLNVNCEGRLIPQAKYRGKKRVIRAMLKEMENCAQDGTNYSGRCFISQSFCRTDAEEVARLVEEHFPKLDGKVIINDIGTVIGSHTGPGTVALFFWGDERN